MRVINITDNGDILEFNSDCDFWMEKDIVWASASYPDDNNHEIYYNDDAMLEADMVRVKIKDKELPLPVWIVGVKGESTEDATLSIDKIRKDINTTG